MVAVVRQVQYLSPSLHGVLAEANMAFVGRDGSQLFVVVLGNSMHDVTFLRSWLDRHFLVRCQFHQLLVSFPSQPGQLVYHRLWHQLLDLGKHFWLRHPGSWLLSQVCQDAHQVLFLHASQAFNTDRHVS